LFITYLFKRTTTTTTTTKNPQNLAALSTAKAGERLDHERPHYADSLRSPRGCEQRLGGEARAH
jgi:hypothetical protein